ncbi:serine protease ea-like [Halictus rubicundus]|uniref:serine protease ea-like n=1 Tax=Halictus rubicundus TaxID=77578 RepID=UPI004035695A
MMNLLVSSVFLQALILYSVNAQYTGPRGFDGTDDPFNNNPLLPTECGKDLSSRIVGGERTDIDEFPWIALLEYATPSRIQTPCGGVLITRRYVLTAAHCINGQNMPSTWSLQSVRLGEYDTSTAVDCIKDGNGTQICADEHISVTVEETIVHENYQPTSRNQTYDIALIRLSRDVPFTNYVKPICLPSNESIGQKLVVAGWGKTKNGESASTLKLKVSLSVVEWQQCQTVYGTVGINLDPSQICAGGEKDKDPCIGNAGGPLMALERSPVGAAKWTVVGLVSFGPSPCGMEGWPGVYTKVSHYMPWILSKLRP